MTNMKDEQSTRDKILYLLKTKGPKMAQELADTLELTSMGARQQLHRLEQEGLVSHYEDNAQRGRPKRFWCTTEKAEQQFPDSHAELAVSLIQSINSAFGENGLDQIIQTREHQMLKLYQQEIDQHNHLENKLKALAKLRRQEGYMAEVKKADDCFYLLENHCPICIAAKHCQNFCRSELEVFQNVLGDKVKVSRTEHIIQGARRCAYKITKNKK
ncbi:helix-turn-helix transcriptional regulator [Piscirickettsia litoralis]|uniref:HTH arsR-type domain-containing protein n=1 Tax=Piscirickettsia litoralis TaxID=1891921 RepID=A0ABX3A3R8_9GAMM|nr:metalloregulator ArsR/SmtB family transcription factor [Piscirickettsia litoralis]ODN43170.1 hypothetical protein BGC07_09890 [Piscirickettsia litoralis]